MLKEEGIDPSEKSLAARLAEFASPLEGLEAAYRNLGAEEFKEREEAQRTLLQGGRATLDLLNGGEAVFDGLTVDLRIP